MTQYDKLLTEIIDFCTSARAAVILISIHAYDRAGTQDHSAQMNGIAKRERLRVPNSEVMQQKKEDKNVSRPSWREAEKEREGGKRERERGPRERGNRVPIEVLVSYEVPN